MPGEQTAAPYLRTYPASSGMCRDDENVTESYKLAAFTWPSIVYGDCKSALYVFRSEDKAYFTSSSWHS